MNETSIPSADSCLSCNGCDTAEPKNLLHYPWTNPRIPHDGPWAPPIRPHYPWHPQPVPMPDFPPPAHPDIGPELIPSVEEIAERLRKMKELEKSEKEKSGAATPEPEPKKDNPNPPISDMVVQDLLATLRSDNDAFIVSKVADDVMARKEFGAKKYGDALRGFNDRNPLMDLYQELQDGAVYCRQAIYECEKRMTEPDVLEARRLLREHYTQILLMLVSIKRLMERATWVTNKLSRVLPHFGVKA